MDLRATGGILTQSDPFHQSPGHRLLTRILDLWMKFVLVARPAHGKSPLLRDNVPHSQLSLDLPKIGFALLLLIKVPLSSSVRHISK